MTSFRAPSAQLQRPLLHVLAALMTCNLASRFARHISTQRDTNVGVTPRNGNTTSLNVVRRVRGASKNVISPRPARRRYAVHKYTRATLPTFFFNYVTNEHVNRKSRDISAQWSGKVPLCAGRFRCPRKCPRKWPTGLQQIATSELPPSGTWPLTWPRAAIKLPDLISCCASGGSLSLSLCLSLSHTR